MDSLVGKALVAMPEIGDPRFSSAVILMCAHNADFAMGLTLNKPIQELTLPNFLDQLDIEQSIKLRQDLVLDGGPVGSDRGFVLHSPDYYGEGVTVDLGEGLAMTATLDILQAIARDTGPQKITLTLGYSGWSGGQLERELAENCWIVVPASEALVFNQSHSSKWAGALNSIGIDPARLHGGGGSA